jgi:hypothetical protein
VWSLTWRDVLAFHEATEAAVTSPPPDKRLLTRDGRRTAQDVHHQLGDGTLDVAAADHNPMRLLIEFLAKPDMESWEQLAASVSAGLARQGSQQAAAQAECAAVLRAALHLQPSPSTAGEGLVTAAAQIAEGLPVTAILDARAEVGGQAAQRWTVVATIDDRPEALREPEHPARWGAWLQLANVLQFLRRDRQAWFTAVSEADSIDIDDFDVVLSPFTPVLTESEASPDGPGDAAREELDLIVDHAARALVEQVLAVGGPIPEAGYEPGGTDGWLLEVAWPAQRVAVLAAGAHDDAALTAWLTAHDWEARPANAWTADELRSCIEERS